MCKDKEYLQALLDSEFVTNNFTKKALKRAINNLDIRQDAVQPMQTAGRLMTFKCTDCNEFGCELTIDVDKSEDCEPPDQCPYGGNFLLGEPQKEPCHFKFHNLNFNPIENGDKRE